MQVADCAQIQGNVQCARMVLCLSMEYVPTHVEPTVGHVKIIFVPNAQMVSLFPMENAFVTVPQTQRSSTTNVYVTQGTYITINVCLTVLIDLQMLMETVFNVQNHAKHVKNQQTNVQTAFKVFNSTQ